MNPPATGLHPEHAREQAYLEVVRRAAEQTRARAERSAEVAVDKYAARTARQHMLERFKDPVDLDALCFGRIDLEDGSTRYLGRAAVHDDHSKLLVINWRMPAAGPFYTATPTEPEGLELRRRFQLDDIRLLGIIDEAFGNRQADVAASMGDENTPLESIANQAEVVDAILADMDRARGSEMRDIVATIEARQYELISDTIDGLLVIQGGPGSGKTAIALHRAAWLLYNHQEELERAGVLVVGPNRAFMEYVAGVLPTLGEMSVVQSAVDRLPDLGAVRVRGTEGLAIARIKGDLRMAEVVQRAVKARVRPPSEDIPLSVSQRRVVLPGEEVLELIRRASESTRPYLTAREAFRRELVSLAQQRFDELRGPRPATAEVEMEVTGTGGPLDAVWPTVTAADVIRDLLSSRRRLAAVGGSLTEEEREALRRERAPRLGDEPWTQADIPLLDEADVALRGITSTYGYVLADEAQDLSPMQLRMILRRASGGRATLVGDIAQATGPTRYPDWTDLLEAAAVDTDTRIAELAIGYRVPRQIMDLASQLLPRIAPKVIVPTAVRDGPEDPGVVRVDRSQVALRLVEEAIARAEGERSVAVIAPSGELERLRGQLIDAGLQAGDVLTDGLTRQLTVLSADQAKGLEFDHVIVVEPVDIAGSDEDWTRVYIALTRATRTLTVLYSTLQPFERSTSEEGPSEGELEVAPPGDLSLMAPAPRGPLLGPRYSEALLQAKFFHSGQHRRGTFVPYLAHLQATSALVLEDGGSEDEAIAALLHDAVEDYGPPVLDKIVEQFGMSVARIVVGCTDPDDVDGSSWHERKIKHMRELETSGPQVRRVALAEKLDNARALLRDYRRIGDALWVRMDVDDEELLWYFGALVDLFVTERPGDMASEFQDTVERLLDAVSQPAATT